MTEESAVLITERDYISNISKRLENLNSLSMDIKENETPERLKGLI